MKTCSILKSVLLVLMAGVGAAMAGTDTGLNLIPWPAQVSQRPGVFILTPESRIVADHSFVKEAEALASAIVTEKGSHGGGIALTKADSLPAEGYRLEVTPSGVTITASTPAGAFYGCQTLRQLVKDRIIPCVSIEDTPRIAWRGFMLDVSRHFFDKEEVKAVLDQMAALKLNVFHWHLTDDHGWRIEIKKYPKLTSVGAWHPITGMEKASKHSKDGRYGGFYTQEEIREVVAYAAALHIRVVPEIDMPGHMSAAAASYPELSPANGWTPIVARQERGSGERCAALCVARPQTVQFCKDVLAEVVELFPSKEIHVGGDEVFYEQWASCPDMKAYKEKLGAKHWEDVQIAFGNEIVAFLAGKGRTAIFWNNIYRQTVDKRAINHFWRNMGNARDFANGGYDVLMSPYLYYFDHGFPLETVYKYDPLNIGVKPEAQSRLRGIEGCAWTERVANSPQLQDRIYPRLIAIAENGWTPQDKKDWDSFRTRLAYASSVPEKFREQALKVLMAPVPTPQAAAPKTNEVRKPIPEGNLACWRPARLLNLDSTAELKSADGATSAASGVDGAAGTVSLPAAKGPWIYEVDLGKVTMIGRVVVTFGKTAIPARFDLAVSDDGKVWRTVLEKKGHDGGSAEVTFSPVEARYAQVIAPKGDLMGIAELEVYGGKGK